MGVHSLVRQVVVSLALSSASNALTPINLLPLHGDQGLSWQRHENTDLHTSSIDKDYPHIKAYNFSVPIDHFHNDSRYEPHSDGKFPMRYWLDASNYKRGGPVIVLHSGEFPSEGRLPYLQHGIVPILTKATGGLGLIMEHRYYGASYPVPNTTTHNLRFLSTDQALADAAYFAQNIKFPGLEDVDLTAPGTPWIIYGGSYAGALAAFARKLYPDVYWGAISSSGVTAVVDEFWQYFEAARKYAPGNCGRTQQKLTHIVDTVLFSGDEKRIERLKAVFGLDGLEDDVFANSISRGISNFQSTNWDPEEDTASVGTYCAVITSTFELFSSTWHLKDMVKDLVRRSGLTVESSPLHVQFLNYIGYVRDYVKRDLATGCRGKTKEQCYSPRLGSNSTEVGSASWHRSWTYQVCTEWGYFVTGSGVPKGQLPVISRAVTYELASEACGRLFNITERPDTDIINKHGGFNFSYPRVALIDGEQDPWRAATPHADGLPTRTSTQSEPFLLIDWAVHHWDEFGVAEELQAEGFPPAQVKEAQDAEVEIVQAWMKEWHEEKGARLHDAPASEEL